MDELIDRTADDWIAYTRLPNSNRAAEEVIERAWVLNDLVLQQPSLAWEIIKNVINRFSEGEVFASGETEAQRILANLGAGPLEDLLEAHGPSLIDVVENEARRDRRVMWTMGCVWTSSRSDELGAKVKRAAGGI